MALFLQIFTFLIIVGLGMLSFKLNPLVVTTKKITVVALLVVLSVALQFFSLMIPLFGFPSLRIDFLQIPLMMIGVLFGPSWAFIAGITQDVIGLIITPTGFPFFGFMLNKILMGMIPALLFHFRSRISNQKMNQLVLLLLGLFLIGSLSYVWRVETIVVESTTMEITNLMKVGISVVSLMLIGGLIVFVYTSTQKYQNRKIPVAFWALSVLLVEVVVSLMLTPTWLYAMYKIPVLLSFLVRVVKATIMVPILMMVGYALLSLIEKLKIEDRQR
jgi:ECF transporter S component (folate family)